MSSTRKRPERLGSGNSLRAAAGAEAAAVAEAATEAADAEAAEVVVAAAAAVAPAAGSGVSAASVRIARPLTHLNRVEIACGALSVKNRRGRNNDALRHAG